MICLVALLFLVTSCGKAPKLENGQEAVVTIKDGEDISVDELYEEMKKEDAINLGAEAMFLDKYGDIVTVYKIGDFSKMSKTTIKTLRYYEKEGLL